MQAYSVHALEYSLAGAKNVKSAKLVTILANDEPFKALQDLIRYAKNISGNIRHI